MKNRFKNQDQNAVYNTYINLAPELALKISIQNARSNRDLAFKSGYLLWPHSRFQRNSLLYAIFVAGKEYKIINKIK